MNRCTLWILILFLIRSTRFPVGAALNSDTSTTTTQSTGTGRLSDWQRRKRCISFLIVRRGARRHGWPYSSRASSDRWNHSSLPSHSRHTSLGRHVRRSSDETFLHYRLAAGSEHVLRGGEVALFLEVSACTHSQRLVYAVILSTSCPSQHFRLTVRQGLVIGISLILLHRLCSPKTYVAMSYTSSIVLRVAAVEASAYMLCQQIPSDILLWPST